MSATEETEDVVMAEVPVGNPDEITKNPTALKEAYKEMAVLDVLVCGGCNAVFHFVKNFEKHKEEGCTGESPIKDINEREAQIWAFLLWKCSSAPEGSDMSHNNSWKLYQQWCRMPMPHRTAWITAGTNVLSTSKFSHARTELKTDDQQVPVQVPSEKKRGRPRKHKIEDTDGGEESDFSNPMKKPNIPKKVATQAFNKLKTDESVRNAQERVPPEERVARRTERSDGESITESGEFIVEKILAKRFNPRKKQYEFLLKWEGYPHEQNTWEPIENLSTCKNLLEAFEKQLARQKELKALRAQMEQQGGQQPVKVKQVSTPVSQLLKPKKESPTYTPTGRLQRSSKARALDQVKAWCGATDDETSSVKKFKKDTSSEDEDYSESAGSGEDSPMKANKLDKKTLNGQTSPKSAVDPELVKKLGLAGKGMPNIKGVIKVDPKQIPNLSSGVYIMSKSSGIIKIDSPGKPGANIDQDAIRKQILAAKQARKIGNSGEHITEKTIITPCGQKIIQKTVQRPSGSLGKSPVTILNKKLGLQGESSLLRRGTPGRGRGRGGSSAGYSITTASGNIIRLREKNPSLSFDFDSEGESDTSDGIEDPFPRELGPIPSPSPDRELTLCPLTGKRLARAEGEPTPPPTPSPPPPPQTPPHTTMLMKVEMSPGGTTGMLVQGDVQPSLPMLTDEDGTEVKVEASAVKQLLEEGVDEGEEVSLLHSDAHPIMIRGEDGVLYQVTGENEDGETVLVPAEGVEGVEGAADGEGDEVMYVTRDDSQEVLTLDPTQLAQLLPGEGSGPLQQVTVQVEGEPGEEATQVIAQLVHSDVPSPGGTRRVVLLLPDGSFTMTELDKEQFESITENNPQE